MITPGRRRKRQVFIVENSPVPREGFAELIDHQRDLEVCGKANTAAAALAGIHVSNPDLVIVDFSHADHDGMKVVKDIATAQSNLPVLVLSMRDESLHAERALRAGARGYVTKRSPTRKVMGAIRQVLGGGLFFTAALRAKLA